MGDEVSPHGGWNLRLRRELNDWELAYMTDFFSYLDQTLVFLVRYIYLFLAQKVK